MFRLTGHLEKNLENTQTSSSWREQTTAENWQTAAAVIMQRLCVKMATVVPIPSIYGDVNGTPDNQIWPFTFRE